MGCARNEVDSEELAGRLAAGGWRIVDADAEPDAVLVNTCGFISAAKRESIDMVLGLADTHPASRVVAAGCLAERYGSQLAESLPEAAAVVGFDRYDEIASVLDRIVAGEPIPAHEPVDRRRLLPVTPISRRPATVGTARRLTEGWSAPLKIASGCDRRCAFCAIPAFRGAFASRPDADVIDEVRVLMAAGKREIVIVAENTTSYGKDLAEGVDLATLLRRLDSAVRELADHPVRIRMTYLQPNELRPALIDAVADGASIAPYFDISFQHAHGAVLRRMRRPGSADSFLRLLERIRSAIPGAGIRSNFIVGFPGETAGEFAALEDFVAAAELDAVGVFAYSDEDGTEAREMGGKLGESEIRARADRLATLADGCAAARADVRIGERVQVLIDSVVGTGTGVGKAGHQGPEDGETKVTLGAPPRPGTFVSARVGSTSGVDLVAVEES